MRPRFPTELPRLPLPCFVLPLLAFASCRATDYGPGARRHYSDGEVDVTWSRPEPGPGSIEIRRIRVEPVPPARIDELEVLGIVDRDRDGAPDSGHADSTTRARQPFTGGRYIELGQTRVAATDGVRFFLTVKLAGGGEARIELR